jgi:vancomycin resistance protein YoaR
MLNRYINDNTPFTTVPVKKIAPTFNSQQAKLAKDALERFSQQPLTLHHQDQIWTLNQLALFKLLDFQPVIPTDTPQTDSIGVNIIDQPAMILNRAKLEAFLTTIAITIDQEPQDAKFVFDPSAQGNQKVSEFAAAKEGRQLDKDKTIQMISEALTAPQASYDITLPIVTTQPTITTANVNNLGITTLLGHGESKFTGSIEGRITNVKLAASRINGTIVPPGEEFSYNKAVGDVDAAHGFAQAYVIKSGKTVLDDGGGVCQDSTTVFRAALNAGLPITERTAHAYRVGYYEQGGYPPGLDATVFAPSVDFRFKNDTPAHILVQAVATNDTLSVDIYGTSDGRQSEVTTPVILSSSPPPPEVRQDDPTLPKGEIRQTEHAAYGANVQFKRTVTRNGQVLINETFKSIYRPWAAVYLVGTKEG